MNNHHRFPPAPADRIEVYRQFNGLSAEAAEGCARPKVPLVKSFLLEHVGRNGGGRCKPPARIFQHLGADVREIDSQFLELRFETEDPRTKQKSWETTGYLEQYDERFFAYYTTEKSEVARRRVSRWVQEQDLDNAWFSSALLQGLWERDVSRSGDERFGKLIFRHESIFEMPEDSAAPEPDATFEAPADDEEAEEEDEEWEDQEAPPEERREFERRKARFEMGDRIGRIQRALSELQRTYPPLNALYALRIPSQTGRGGHDIYQTGQLTNRSGSFEDHRNMLRYLYRIYSSILNHTEECAWTARDRSPALRASPGGAPLIIKFKEPLSLATFDRMIQLAFQRRNRFKLWGQPIRLGPGKVHVYGADRHLWQPINLELTTTGMVAMLPQNTCGNTFHRLVTTVQHYISPDIEAWIGDKPFGEVVRHRDENSELSNGH